MTSIKIVIAGGFGVGKTTFVKAVSEIEPLMTEGAMTVAGDGVDDRRGVADKTTTTVALDFGRISLDPTLVLYLFGTPGQQRFEFLWDELTTGALGAVVLLDTARIEDCYPALDYLERHGTPFIVAVNLFDDAPRFDLDEVGEALGVTADVPVIDTDCRDRERVKQALLALIQMLLENRDRAPASARAG